MSSSLYLGLESPIWALLAIAIALLSTGAAIRLMGPAPAANRFASIDGLRGYLAFAVLLHHAAIWFGYLRAGEWQPPATNLFMHFGQSGVALFFMITAFLFTSKLLAARQQGIDWRAFFVSRIVRLSPLYLFAMGLLATITAAATHFTLAVPPSRLLSDFAIWLGFSVLGQPDLNGLVGTRAVLAGVTWSLPFEWFFYFALPVLAVVAGLRPPRRYVILGLVASALFLAQGRDNLLAYYAFAIGILTAFPARSAAIRQAASGSTGSIAASVCLVLAVLLTYSPSSHLGLLLIGAAFLIIACGNTLFGLLASSLSRKLGEISYSLYLLHGAVLFVSFRFIVGIEAARQLSPVQHWWVVLACVPVLIAICCLSYRYIEAPGIRLAGPIMRWLARPSASALDSASLTGGARPNR